VVPRIQYVSFIVVFDTYNVLWRLSTTRFYMKKATASAAVERAIQAEKKAVSMESKLRKVEEEMEQLRRKMRESPEMALMQEIAQLKGQLAESESRIQHARADCTKAQLEKEQHKAQVHRLVRFSVHALDGLRRYALNLLH